MKQGFLGPRIPCGAGMGELTFPYAHGRGPAESLAGGALFHLATPVPLTPQAPQAPGG